LACLTNENELIEVTEDIIEAFIALFMNLSTKEFFICSSIAIPEKGLRRKGRGKFRLVFQST
jgi:hypothetical protein